LPESGFAIVSSVVVESASWSCGRRTGRARARGIRPRDAGRQDRSASIFTEATASGPVLEDGAHSIRRRVLPRDDDGGITDAVFGRTAPEKTSVVREDPDAGEAIGFDHHRRSWAP
jgi:hypothetical protein